MKYMLSDQLQGANVLIHHFTATEAGSFLKIENDYWNIYSGGVDFLVFVYNQTQDPTKAAASYYPYRLDGAGNHHVVTVKALEFSEGDVVGVWFQSYDSSSGSQPRVANVTVSVDAGPESFN